MSKLAVAGGKANARPHREVGGSESRVHLKGNVVGELHIHTEAVGDETEHGVSKRRVAGHSTGRNAMEEDGVAKAVNLWLGATVRNTPRRARARPTRSLSRRTDGTQDACSH